MNHSDHLDASPVPSAPPQRTGATRPLIVTADDALLDDLLRLTAASGVTPDVAPDAGGSRRWWSSASLVLVGQDAADAVGSGAPPRRAGVVVVTRRPAGLQVWQQALSLGAERVLELPADEAAIIDLLTDTVEDGGRSTLMLAVIGGCGGAGASTFAAGLGVAAGRARLRALLVDGDPLGGGVDLTLGSESAPGVRWPDLMGTSGRVSAPSLREALPQSGALSVLSWDRGDLSVIPPAVMREVLAAGRRGHDIVVVDLPRRIDPASEEALLKADTTLVVVPAEVRAVAAARRVVVQLTALTSHLELVVRGPGPAGLDGRLVAETLDLPLAVEMRPERGLHAALDLGEGPWRRGRGALGQACRSVLRRQLDLRESAA